tara:strand:- start:177 stop:401 length:225 start_codon:yes stop_codon:yes gene_type:complete
MKRNATAVITTMPRPGNSFNTTSRRQIVVSKPLGKSVIFFSTHNVSDSSPSSVWGTKRRPLPQKKLGSRRLFRP